MKRAHLARILIARVEHACSPQTAHPKELAVASEVAAWREREAQTRDVPRDACSSELVGDIAVQAPATIERARSLRSLPKGRARAGEAIVEAVKARLARDARTLPKLDLHKPRQRPRDRRAPQGASAHDLGAPWRRRQGDRTTDDLDRIAADDRPMCRRCTAGARELSARRRSPSSTDVWRWRWKGRVVTVDKDKDKKLTPSAWRRGAP